LSHRILLRGGHVLSMDSEVGDLVVGDVPTRERAAASLDHLHTTVQPHRIQSASQAGAAG
jgi:hypothetical protein